MSASTTVIVLLAVSIVLLVNVSVVFLPTNVSVDDGKVIVPVFEIVEITGVFKVLFVSVSVVSFNTTVPVASGSVIVLSAVGSVTASVVSNGSALAPSNVKEPCKNKLPPSENVAYLPELSPSIILPCDLPLKTTSPI